MRISISIVFLVLLSFQTVKSEIISITCDYDKFASIQSVENTIEIFRLSFSVNKDTSEAQVMRKNGISDVQLYPTGGGFTFIEINERGNVLTTTIDIHGKTVHSRNTILDGELIPSQFYGHCNYK